MIAQLVKLCWNRRRANLLITVEILVAFLVVAGVSTVAAYHIDHYRQPTGYEVRDLWEVSTRHAFSLEEGQAIPAELDATLAAIITAARGLPEVIAAGGAGSGPYRTNSRGTQTLEGDEPGAGLRFDVDTVTDDFGRTIGMELLHGRWFGKEDDGAGYLPVVINRQMAEDFFGTSDVVGRTVFEERAVPGGPKRPVRVVGVVAAYRQAGELSAPLRYLLKRHVPGANAWNNLFLRVRPGTTAEFEARLEDRLRAVARGGWTFRVHRVEQLRASARKATLTPLYAAGIIAGFLLLMVVLGLTGVLWQNVTQRTREIGLRRAKGATRLHIHAQILGELLVLTTLAIGIGLIVITHLPILDLSFGARPLVLLEGAGVAALVIVALACLCALYPAHLATRLEPAVALHQE